MCFSRKKISWQPDLTSLNTTCVPDSISRIPKCASRNDELKSNSLLKNKNRQVHAPINNPISKVNSHDCQVEASGDHEGPGSARKRRTPSPSETVPHKSAHL